jgi:hypothetical protein
MEFHSNDKTIIKSKISEERIVTIVKTTEKEIFFIDCKGQKKVKLLSKERVEKTKNLVDTLIRKRAFWEQEESLL